MTYILECFIFTRVFNKTISHNGIFCQNKQINKIKQYKTNSTSSIVQKKNLPFASNLPYLFSSPLDTYFPPFFSSLTLGKEKMQVCQVVSALEIRGVFSGSAVRAYFQSFSESEFRNIGYAITSRHFLFTLSAYLPHFFRSNDRRIWTFLQRSKKRWRSR